jgi:hypothetical protein
MFRTLRAKNSWREGQSFRDLSHRLASVGVRSGYCKTRPCSVVCFPMLMGLLLSGGLWLRDDRLRALVPLQT